MRKLGEEFHDFVPAVRLHLDDVYQITSLIDHTCGMPEPADLPDQEWRGMELVNVGQYAPEIQRMYRRGLVTPDTIKFRMVAGYYLLASPEEIECLPSPIQRLSLQTAKPQVRLRLSPAGVQIDGDETAESYRLAHVISQIVRSCRLKWWERKNVWRSILGILFSSSALVTLLILKPHPQRMGIFSILFGMGSIGMLLSAPTLMIRDGSSEVVLKRREERKSFFARNKEQIAVGTIIAVIGALVGALLALVFSRH